MDLFYSALVVLHVVGIVAIGYGFFKELAKKTFGVNVAMLHGASTQLLTGILMVGLRESGVVADEDIRVTTALLSASTSSYMILYRTGATEWSWSESQTFPYLYGTTMKFYHHKKLTCKRFNSNHNT
jgi:hypothetical protein